MTSITNSLTVLEHNTQILCSEYNQIIQTLKATVQAQNTAENGLLDRISILQAEVEDERRHNAALEKALRVERAATAALERQLQQLQAEVIELRKKDAVLKEAIAVRDALEAQEWPDYAKLEEVAIRQSTYRRELQDQFIAAANKQYHYHNGVPISPHWKPLHEILDKAKK